MNQPHDPQSIADQLCRFARTQLLAEEAPFDAHTPLTDAGLDSFSLVELLLFSERTFGVSVPESHLTRENLDTLAALGRCIADLAAASVTIPQPRTTP
jgi:acyl carrier protein